MIRNQKIYGIYGKEMDINFLNKMQENQQNENYMIEFKPSGYLHPEKKRNKYEEYHKNCCDLTKKIASFANTEGGFIFFGISEKNGTMDKISGCDFDVWPVISQNLTQIQPMPQVEMYKPISIPNDPKRAVYIIEVFRSNRPTMICGSNHPRKGTIPIRKDDSTQIADIRQVAMIFHLKKEERSLDKLIRLLIQNIQEMFSAENIVVSQMKFERIRKIAKSLPFEPILSLRKGQVFILDKFRIVPKMIISHQGKTPTNSKTDPSLRLQLSNELSQFLKDYYNIHINVNL